MQCKERVDLLDALRKSRKESKEREKSLDSSTVRPRPPQPPQKKPESMGGSSDYPTPGWIGQGTVPPINYPDISRSNPPPLPHRPAAPPKESIYPIEHVSSSTSTNSMPPPAAPAPAPYNPPPPPTLPVPAKRTSRTPSPDKKGGRMMLTTLRGPKDAKKKPISPRAPGGRFTGAPPASSKAAGLAWDTTTKTLSAPLRQSMGPRNTSSTTVDSVRRDSTDRNSSSRPESTHNTDGEQEALGGNALVKPASSRMAEVPLIHDHHDIKPSDHGLRGFSLPLSNGTSEIPNLIDLEPPTPPAQESRQEDPLQAQARSKSPIRPKQPGYPSYRTEFPPQTASSRATAEFQTRPNVRRAEAARTTSAPVRERSPHRQTRPPKPSAISRRPLANMSSPRPTRRSSESNDETTSSNNEVVERKKRVARKQRNEAIPVDPALPSTQAENSEGEVSSTLSPSETAWQSRVKHVKKNLPKGVDEAAAKQIFNEIVVHGDEVHWSDVAGLEVAKKALKEAVVYPFLRPDLFMGLREPARGMLLFGPPGTGKTMLARAVATESKSTFFAISASSLTSKWLGESEKLVRALFSLAKALAPSIIFVDEIDSLLSSRGGSSEHESTRRIKTEFLIQWSDLQRAAAGKQQSAKEQAEGDASRVLVLAATNTPWAIDEAARRRFVRRQYIPLPEAPVRGEQIRTLLGHQKHKMSKQDIQVLVELTDGSLSFLPFSTYNPCVLTRSP